MQVLYIENVAFQNRIFVQNLYAEYVSYNPNADTHFLKLQVFVRRVYVACMAKLSAASHGGK